MAQSPDQMAASMLANIKDKTGKPLSHWTKVLKAAKLEKHGEMVKLLKSEHGVTHGFANMIVHEYRKAAEGVPAKTDLVSAQYSGAKADLKPIYDKLIAVVNQFGKDVEVAPKKAYVSLRRSKQFALIQPSTRTRVDVGINLKGEPAGERLEASGSFNAMVSHRVRVSAAKEVDKQLIDWLKRAYQAA